MNYPCYTPEPLPQHSTIVNGNWRVTFRFSNGDTEIVNYEDYH